MLVHFPDATATDDSGTVVLICRSHDPGDTFPVGDTAVTYNFSDGSGNTASCTFVVLIITGRLS